MSSRARTALVASGLTAALAAATVVAPAFAADPLTNDTHSIRGTVRTIPASCPGGTSFSVTTKKYGGVIVSFSGATVKAKGHTKGKAKAYAVANGCALKVGDRVQAKGRASGTTFNATRVQVLPAKTERSVGTFVSFLSNVLTLNVSGTNKTFTLTADTKIRPEGTNLASLPTTAQVTVVSKGSTVKGVSVKTS